MMKRTLSTICLATVLSLTGGTLSLAYSGGDFTIYPTYSHEGNKTWIIAKTAPGSQMTETVTLENLSAETQEITLLVREAKEENGQFKVNQAGDSRNIGAWITAEGNSYTLAPHQKIRIPLMISVPEDAKDGQYTAAVFASKTDSTGENLNIVTRIGVRIYLTVTPATHGYTDIFTAPGNKSSFFLYLSSLGLFASILYYMYEKKYA